MRKILTRKRKTLRFCFQEENSYHIFSPILLCFSLASESLCCCKISSRGNLRRKIVKIYQSIDKFWVLWKKLKVKVIKYRISVTPSSETSAKCNKIVIKFPRKILFSNSINSPLKSFYKINHNIDTVNCANHPLEDPRFWCNRKSIYVRGNKRSAQHVCCVNFECIARETSINTHALSFILIAGLCYLINSCTKQENALHQPHK